MITRRHLFAAGGALLGTAGATSAAMQCYPVNYGVNQCEVGLPSITVNAAESQECQQWCWAACISSVFRYYGVPVSQSRIVSKVFGGNICAPAQGFQIIYAIRGDWTSDNGRTFRAFADPLVDLQFGVFAPNAGAQAAQLLAAGSPLINGAVGHATVLTAMSYLIDMYNRTQITNITVRDPWNPGGANAIRRTLSQREVAGTNFLAKIAIT